MINSLVHLYERIVYPYRWKVKYAQIKLEDGSVKTFKEPDYYGNLNERIVVLPNDKEEQVSYMKSSVLATKTVFDK